MAWLVGPATDLSIAAKLAARVDQILGYPRDIAESELTRIGRVPPGGWATVHTETAPLFLQHDLTGATQLQGAWALQTDAVIESMQDTRNFSVDGGAKRKLRQLITDRGWTLVATIPGQPDAWSVLPARNGLAGSADGVPIPEGQE